MVDFPPGFQPEHESPTASLSLLESMRKREQSAWSRFHSLYCPSIYVYCQRAGIDAASADDVCQEVLTAVTRGLPGFAKRSSIDSFRGWLYRIAANNIIDFFRKARTEVHGRGGEAFHQHLEGVPEELSSDSELALPPEHLEFQRAIETMRETVSPSTWGAFWGMVVDGKSAAELAIELNMKEGAVRQAKARFLQRFRAEYGDILDLGNE